MRTWHRWISIMVIVFMSTIAVTGVMLTSEMWIARLQAAQRCTAVGLTLQSAPANREGSTPAERACRIRATPLHEALVRIHTGNAFGTLGRTFSLLSGLGLLFFCLSGMWMYIQMYRRRLSLGRRPLFWH